MVIELLTQRYAVCRLKEPVMPEGGLVSLTMGYGEISLVCEEEKMPACGTAEMGWRALRVRGPLDFSLVGILSELSGALARAGVSIFALSTYDTDYLLVKQNQLETAKAALTQAGYSIVEE